MHQVGILEAKTNFSALVRAVEKGGGEVTVTRHGKAAVKIVRAEESSSSRTFSAEALASHFEALREDIATRNPEAAIRDPVGIIRLIRDKEDD